MYAAKAAQGQVPTIDLCKFINLLGAIDWSRKERTIPVSATVPGMRHIQAALAEAYAKGSCPIVDALRLCIGITPWETYYADCNWSRPFLQEFDQGNW